MFKVFLHLAFLFEFLTLTLGQDHEKICREKWTLFKASSACYKKFPSHECFDSAEANCVHEGGHLVSFHSQKEMQFITDRYSQSSIDRLWIGFHKVGNTWEWTDKTEVDYTFWIDGEPKDHENQLPIAAFTYLFDENKWLTREKNETSGYICKYLLK
ncbi:unnamed protein product, partial [Mesorhabditis belari]|uniref:C-type lectin domain-containing protein n=1 Tax=Mesorhabditis belari TaxID=2138241 RepID=A0AAF3EC10_9BILA